MLAGIWHNLVDYLLPPVCGSCGEAVQGNQGVCADCWGQLTFLGDPCCQCCGYPFELSPGKDALCGDCQGRPKAFDCCRAALSYDAYSKDMIIGYKHADRTHLTAVFAQWMSGAGRELWSSVDVLVPVPLHPRRLLARRYNQSALLAKALARQHGKAFAPDLLLRRKNTVSQGQLSSNGRWRNVAGAFDANPARKVGLEGQNILLIDDVYTTGATLDACSKVLRKAGAGSVRALVLARVLREG
ncbi:ComF family protein [Kiloniella laminariae]|uniref:ComF family protein n=1 Tax=Kiloniella laminariae TaxID=454162 RepID=A0ABT4LM34_9PROT|nr:ComF family protein [Kiloniella laminariae]MCZ4282163.1 ComF family protein [Kiloniella laminariae]